VFLATPAIAGGRLFLRTNEALYCIAETGKARLAHSVKVLSGTFAELKSRYEKHQAEWTNEAEAHVRLETLEAIARLDDPQVVAFLLHTVEKEPHWDICEEAVKSLGRKGPPAIDSLVGLVKDSRPFIRTVAINDLGRLKAARAVPQLLVATHDKQPLVRAASLHALAQIGQAGTDSARQIVAMLIAVLAEGKGEEAVVKQSALDGLALLAGQANAQREEVLRALVAVQQCGNPRLARKSQEILSNVYTATPGEIERARHAAGR
jgi:HEAT repeat protein